VNVVDGIAFFDNSIFKDLSEGALNVGTGAAVTIKESVQFYNNNSTANNW
jgi:hypothetical protein